MVTIWTDLTFHIFVISNMSRLPIIVVFSFNNPPKEHNDERMEYLYAISLKTH